MKVNLYATQHRLEYRDTLLWSGDMECVPRAGDIIFPFDGWGGARITRVHWDLSNMDVELFIDDDRGEYSDHAISIRKGESDV